MSRDRQATEARDQLPAEVVDRLTKPLGWFFRIEAVGGGLLLVCAAITLVLSNSPWADAYAGVWELSLGIRVGSFEFARSSREWINDAGAAVERVVDARPDLPRDVRFAIMTLVDAGEQDR